MGYKGGGVLKPNGSLRLQSVTKARYIIKAFQIHKTSYPQNQKIPDI
jgi:hypothetical protein